LALQACSTLSLDLFMPKTAPDALSLVFLLALQTQFTLAGLFLLPLLALLKTLSAHLGSLLLNAPALGFLCLFLLGFSVGGVGSQGLPLPFALLLQTVWNLLFIHLIASLSSPLSVAPVGLPLLAFRGPLACWLSRAIGVPGPRFAYHVSLWQCFCP
jgi:hypothetical protein